MKKRILLLTSVLLLIHILWLNRELPVQAQPAAEGSFVFWAENADEAQAVADAYGAVLLSFENGIGTLVMEEVVRETDVLFRMHTGQEETGSTISGNAVSGNTISGNTVLDNTDMTTELYPNYLYTVETESNSRAGGSQWHIDYFKMDSVWKYAAGKGVKVAIVDSGIDTDHPALADRIILAKTVIPESAYGTNGYFMTYKGPDDRLGHGTHVAGIIGAKTADGFVMGMAPECSIYSYKALEKSGNSASGYTSWIANGILTAVEDGADVINLSVGGGTREDQFLAQAIHLAVENGCIIVGAAGNYYGSGLQSKIDYPAAYSDVIAVTAAVKNGDSVNIDLSYSKYGEGVGFIAPGTQIFSTNLDGTYSNKTGTSMATPMVSAAIALLLEEKPQATVQEIEEILAKTALDFGDPGKDIYYGHGMIQPLAAVKSVQPKEEPKPQQNPSEQPAEQQPVQTGGQPTEQPVTVPSEKTEQAADTNLQQQIDDLRQQLEQLPQEDQQLYVVQTQPVEDVQKNISSIEEAEENLQEEQQMKEENTLDEPAEEEIAVSKSEEEKNAVSEPQEKIQKTERNGKCLIWIIPIIIILVFIIQKMLRGRRV